MYDSWLSYTEVVATMTDRYLTHPPCTRMTLGWASFQLGGGGGG